jgi:hypothetical protein
MNPQRRLRTLEFDAKEEGERERRELSLDKSRAKSLRISTVIIKPLSPQ